MATRTKKASQEITPTQNLAATPAEVEAPGKAINSYLRRLRTRLTALSKALRQSALHEAEIELKKCEALSKNVGDLVKFQGLDPMLFFEHFQAINELTIDVTHRIEKLNNVWWRKLWRFVQSNAIQIIKPLASLLGSASGIKLLK